MELTAEMIWFGAILILVVWVFWNIVMHAIKTAREKAQREKKSEERLDWTEWVMQYGTPEQKIEFLQRELKKKDEEARRNAALAAWWWWKGH
jgi:hypothetical protein